MERKSAVHQKCQKNVVVAIVFTLKTTRIITNPIINKTKMKLIIFLSGLIIGRGWLEYKKFKNDVKKLLTLIN